MKTKCNKCRKVFDSEENRESQSETTDDKKCEESNIHTEEVSIAKHNTLEFCFDNQLKKNDNFVSVILVKYL